MNEWRKVRLGDVADVKGGKRLPAGMMLTEELTNHPYIRIRDLTDVKNLEITTAFQYVTDDVQQRISRYIVDEGDVLISIVGTVGLVSIVGRSLAGANLTENCVKIINLKGLDNNYLYYYLKSVSGQYQIRNLTVGAVQPKLPIANILSIQLPLPPLPTQRKIAAVLGALDDKIENNRKICANLEAQAQAIFKSWFVDFEPFGGKMPQGWKMGKLGDVAEITSGKRPPSRTDFQNSQNIYPLIGASSVMGFTSEFLYDRPILVMGRVGTHGIIQRFDNKVWPSDNTLVLISEYHEYVYQILKLIDYKRLNRGSTQPLITQTDIKESVIVLPKDNWLKKFEDYAGLLMKQWSAVECESRALAEMRDALLPKLMSGEIDVEKVKVA